MKKTRSESSRSAGRDARNAKSTKAIAADEFDRRFDAGENVTAHLDLGSARRPGREVQRVNVDFPLDLLRAIDAEAARIGVTRQAFIKMRIADGLPKAS